MDKKKLYTLFEGDFPGIQTFLAEVICPIFGSCTNENENILCTPEALKRAQVANIKSIIQVGTLDETLNSHIIYVYDITLVDNVHIAYSRSNIQQYIRRHEFPFTHAFMLFHYKDSKDKEWRFSYCFKQNTLVESTSAKRFTYLFGKGHRGKTAVERLEILANSDKTDQDLENAFSVEALSDSFFKEYKQFYEAFVEYITGYRYVKKGCKWENTYIHEPDPQFANFKNNQKLVRDYIKKMLGRIVFLYFIQRKGWLNDDSNYMENLFLDSSDEQKNNFLDSVLKPLFFGLLNTLPKDRATIYINNVSPATLPGHKTIPYLNGGLFQQEEIDKCQLQFRADLFDGLFKFLGSYNFTIDENDPDDVEIGIDPEMLGCIFENLLEDNRDKGAYYTPKEIVHYMCRESLIAYLQTDKNNEEKDQIKRFVTNHNAQELREQVSDIDKKLQTVKICDPAIGSGAFPMGMLKELFACRQAIERPNSPDFKASTIKREIIRKNIYGVDIEKGAVDIARLRFWLALIIDEDNPETLPNLDFKIMQGNSLLEGYYKGNTYIDLSTLLYEKEKKNEEKNWLYNEEERNMERLQLRSYIKSYYNEDNHKKKEKLRSKIHGNILNQLHSINLCNSGLEDIDISANSQFFLWHTWFSDVFSRPSKEGFDIMIGNPPYGATYSNDQKTFFKKHFVTSQTKKGLQKGSLDTFTLFIEQGYNLLCKNGVFAFIVPISITSSDAMTGVHRLIFNNCNSIYVSSYAVRPKPVFKNAMVNTSILMMRKTETKCEHLYATKMYRRDEGKFSLANLIEHLQYIDVLGYTLYGRIPKISLLIEKNILQKLKTNGSLIGNYLSTSGFPIVYRFAGGRYFKVVTNYAIGSSAERIIYFDNQELANSIGCILSSNLSFWFYQIYSDNLNWKNYEIENFRIPKLTSGQKTHLSELYGRYLLDIEAKANVRETTGTSSYNVSSFKEYKIVRSKPIIDEIDDYIGPLYGLTSEEIDFVKNYELRFRMSGE